jgi:hypothetical protein
LAGGSRNRRPRAHRFRSRPGHSRPELCSRACGEEACRTEARGPEVDGAEASSTKADSTKVDSAEASGHEVDGSEGDGGVSQDDGGEAVDPGYIIAGQLVARHLSQGQCRHAHGIRIISCEVCSGEGGCSEKVCRKEGAVEACRDDLVRETGSDHGG